MYVHKIRINSIRLGSGISSELKSVLNRLTSNEKKITAEDIFIERNLGMNCHTYVCR